MTFMLMCEPMANEYPLFGKVSLQEYVDTKLKGVAPNKSDSIEGKCSTWQSGLGSRMV